MDLIFPATAAFILAGLVKGVLGFGFPIIALILLTLYIGLLDALAIIVVPTLVTNAWQALSGPHLRAILERMWLYFLCAMTGIFVASWFITRVNVNMLTGLLGAVLFFFAISRLLDIHIDVPRHREPLLSVVLGSVNGLLTGFTGSFMVPSVLYMQALGFGKDMLVQAMGVFFGLSTAMLMIALGHNQLITGHLRGSIVARSHRRGDVPAHISYRRAATGRLHRLSLDPCPGLTLPFHRRLKRIMQRVREG